MKHRNENIKKHKETNSWQLIPRFVPCLEDAGLANVLAVIQRLLFVPIQNTDAMSQTHETAFFGLAVVGFRFARREFFIICTADSSTTGWQTERSVTGHDNKRELPLTVSLQQSYSADNMPAGNRPVAGEGDIFALFVIWNSPEL